MSAARHFLSARLYIEQEAQLKAIAEANGVSKNEALNWLIQAFAQEKGQTAKIVCSLAQSNILT